MSEQPTKKVDEGVEHRFKERITASIGVGVMVTYGIVAIAAVYVAIAGDTEAQNFQHLKDLLTFLSGLVGTVVGYYFGRVGVEKRAEVAESTVQMVQSTISKVEREAANALGQLDGEKLAREAAEKARQFAEDAKDKTEQIAQVARQAQEQAETQIDAMKEDMAEIVQGVQTVRERFENFKDKATGVSQAAAEMFGALGAEGEAPPAVDAQEIDNMTRELDTLMQKASKWQH